MKSLIQNIKSIGIPAVIALLCFAGTLSMLNGCATTAKNSRVTISREATEIWHSYEIQPNYHYYFWGPVSQPFYLVGIDDKYRLKSEQWKPVDLTQEMMKNWFNYIHQRVGISPYPYGSFISGPHGERIGLWYSVRDWRKVGSAHLTEDNQVSLTTPSLTDPRQMLLFYPKRDEPFDP